MSHLNTGQVLGASSAIGGASVLPLTGSSPITLILPIVAIAAGSIILFSLTLIRIIEKLENSKK